MLVQLKAISQKKPDVYVTNKLSDLTLIIQSNERGKAAQQIVPELEKKIFVFDSLLNICELRINEKNIQINAKDIQVKSLYQIVANDSVIKFNDDAIKLYQSEQIKSLNKSLKRQKVKTAFVGGTGLLIIGSLIYLLTIK